MTTLILVRHGEVENPRGVIYGRSVPVKLSYLGVKQIKQLAILLKERGEYPAAIYSSPLERTVASAKAMVEVFGDQVPIKIDDKLLEVDAKGLDTKLISWAVKVDLYTHSPKDYWIEEPNHIATRMIEAMTDIIHLYKGKEVIVMSHGDPLALALWKLLYPDKALPGIRTLRNDGYYLAKGAAWKVVVDENDRVIQHERIGKDV